MIGPKRIAEGMLGNSNFYINLEKPEKITADNECIIERESIFKGK